MSIAARIQVMVETLNEALADAQKFDSGNASAGTRVRQAMQSLKVSAQDTRVAVQETKNARKA